MRAWMFLMVAGLLETVWALGLERSQGFTQPRATALTVVSMVASMFLLGLAVKEIPIGTAYAVWVGIGVVGTFVFGVIVLGEPLSWARTGFALLLVTALAGLKLTTPS